MSLRQAWATWKECIKQNKYISKQISSNPCSAKSQLCLIFGGIKVNGVVAITSHFICSLLECKKVIDFLNLLYKIAYLL
jgi:hypothetical protein